MARKINDYLSTFFPAEALNEANQQARFQYDYPNLSQQMTHNQYAAPYQQFQQEYPQLEQYARDVLSGRVAKRGLQELSSNLNQAIQGNPQALEPYIGFGGMTAFHGSPHKFGKFLMDKIGTGEGAQAYGHGLYFAESPGVAKVYQEQVLDSEKIQSANKRMKDLVKIMDEHSGYGYRNFKDDIGRKAAKEYDELIAAKLEPGHLYEVDIPDEQINKMLDWDAPLSEQPENVRQALADDIRQLHLDSRSGENLYNELSRVYGSPEEASKAMAEMGIPGIKYFDQVSRGTGEGTRNFVVFDEDLVKILDRK